LWENCFKVPCIIVQTGIFLLVGPKVAWEGVSTSAPK
jgi:hypothetical protein